MKKLKRLINSCYYWVRHRTIDKYHVIDTGLPPGYYEKDCQMLHGMFNLLVDHVDCEVAWMELIWKDLPWYMTKKRYIKKHGEMLGMEYLEWAKALKDDEGNPLIDVKYSQAWAAKEIMELYMWWKYARPNRTNPYDRIELKDDFIDRWIKRDPTLDSPLMNAYEISQQYDQEDEDYLIRLVKVRQRLWT